jgi:hypothetical protein
MNSGPSESYRAVLAMLLLLIATVANAGPVTNLPNGNFDTDLTGWTLRQFNPATMAWDGTTGNPLPGSLRLDILSYDRFGAWAESDCMAVASGSFWRVSGVARAEPGASCGVSVVILDDCASVSGEQSTGESTSANTWTFLSSQPLVVNDANRFLRVRLGAGGSLQPFGSSTCYFDSIGLFGPSGTLLPIPTLQPAGLFGLIAAFALCAWWLLWRQRVHA